MGLELPDALPLPLQSGAPYWYWLGGRPALDLVNTRRERWRRGVETLVSVRDLGRWLGAAELVDAPVDASTEQLEQARDLREAIDACCVAAVAGRPLPAGAVGLIDLHLRRSAVTPRLVLDEGRGRLVEAIPAGPVDAALGLIAQDAASLLGVEAETRRLRICAAETCSARFYDRSPAARRRWCSMRDCGNRAKARRHRRRAATDFDHSLPQEQSR